MASIFSQIIAGDIPSYKLYENEHAFVILDIHPLREGHTLVLAKREVTQFFELSDEGLAGVMSAAKKVAEKLNQVFEPKRIVEMAHSYGVEHVHIHLVPTNSYDEFKQAVLDHETTDVEAEIDHDSLQMLQEKLSLED